MYSIYMHFTVKAMDIIITWYCFKTEALKWASTYPVWLSNFAVKFDSKKFSFSKVFTLMQIAGIKTGKIRLETSPLLSTVGHYNYKTAKIPVFFALNL